jgi:hypothetical protein
VFVTGSGAGGHVLRDGFCGPRHAVARQESLPLRGVALAAGAREGLRGQQLDEGVCVVHPIGVVRQQREHAHPPEQVAAHGRLVHGRDAVVSVGDLVDDRRPRPEGNQVRGGDVAAALLHLRDERAGDLAAVEDVRSLPRNELQRVCQIRLPQPLSRAVGRAVRVQEDRAQRRVRGAPGMPREALRLNLRDEEAVAGEVDRRAHQLGQRPCPPPPGGLRQRRQRPRHRHLAPASRTLDLRTALAQRHPLRRPQRRAVQSLDPPARSPHDHDGAPAQTRHPRLHDRERERRRDRGIDRVATPLQHLRPHVRRVGRSGHHQPLARRLAGPTRPGGNEQQQPEPEREAARCRGASFHRRSMLRRASRLQPACQRTDRSFTAGGQRCFEAEKGHVGFPPPGANRMAGADDSLRIRCSGAPRTPARRVV